MLPPPEGVAVTAVVVGVVTEPAAKVQDAEVAEEFAMVAVQVPKLGLVVKVIEPVKPAGKLALHVTVPPVVTVFGVQEALAILPALAMPF